MNIAVFAAFQTTRKLQGFPYTAYNSPFWMTCYFHFHFSLLGKGQTSQTNQTGNKLFELTHFNVGYWHACSVCQSLSPWCHYCRLSQRIPCKTAFWLCRTFPEVYSELEQEEDVILKGIREVKQEMSCAGLRKMPREVHQKLCIDMLETLYDSHRTLVKERRSFRRLEGTSTFSN